MYDRARALRCMPDQLQTARKSRCVGRPSADTDTIYHFKLFKSQTVSLSNFPTHSTSLSDSRSSDFLRAKECSSPDIARYVGRALSGVKDWLPGIRERKEVALLIKFNSSSLNNDFLTTLQR